MNKKPIHSSRQGFTLLEVIVALGVAGVILGTLALTINNSINSRNEAAQLQTAVFLAEQTMNKIKVKTDDSSDSGDFEEFPGFAYEYSIEEVEVDIFELISMAGEGDEEKSEALTYKEERGQFQESASGFINITLKKYKVTIQYGDNLAYTLRMTRGTKLSVNQ